jgi:D-alanyl-D-alanine dipeptidase
MTNDEKYSKLEKGFIQYKDLLRMNNCNDQADKEKFTALPRKGRCVIGKYLPCFNEMQEITPSPLVRETVLQKLQVVDTLLKQQNKDYQLTVTEGWRAMEIQEQKFNEQSERLNSLYTDQTELFEAVHRYIAVPGVSTHPTGGAVDVAIYDTRNNSMLDFGADIYDFDVGRIQYTFSPEIKLGSSAYKNRILLRNVMLSQGFAPYDGEWWHFSFGDKEWATYYGKDQYLYNQKRGNEIKFLQDAENIK